MIERAYAHDSLADLTDEDLIGSQQALKDIAPADLPEDKYKIFEWDQYDWSKFDPIVYGYDVIRLGADGSTRHRTSAISGVYFSLVLPHRKSRLTHNGEKRWYPLPRYSKDYLVHLAGYRQEGGRKNLHNVLLHRRVMSFVTKKSSETVDHINGYSLDSRDFNLRPASFRLNMHNRAPWKESSSGLMRWVEYRNNAETLVGGVFMVNNEKRRSAQTWPVAQQRLAHDWVLAERKKLYGSIPWIDQDPPKLPSLPPLLKRSVNLIGMDIPFP